MTASPAFKPIATNGPARREPVLDEPRRRHTDRPRQQDDAQLEVKWDAFWSTGDRAARNSLVLAYEELANVAVHKLPSTILASWERDDLRSFALIGLIEAVGRFQPGSDVRKFPAYALQRIRGAIFDELRRLDWLPRSIRRRAIQYRETADAVTSNLQRSATPDEVVAAMGIAPSEADAIRSHLQTAQLLQLGADSTAHMADVASIRGDDDPSADLIAKQDRATLQAVIQSLPERERTVIALHFLGGMTQGQIGAMLGISNSRVCQIEAAALRAIRSRLAQVS